MSRFISVRKDGPIFTIEFSREETLNALNDGLLEETSSALSTAESDSSVRVIAIRGRGRAFSSGGDLAEFRKRGDDLPDYIYSLAGKLHEVIVKIRSVKKPVVSIVKGFASGAGFSLSLACDLTIASASSRFNMGYIRVGLSPDGGGSLFLSRIVGLKRASEIFFFGDLIDANTAKDLGIVNYVFPEDTFEEDVKKLLLDLSKRPRKALELTKVLVNASLFPDLFNQLELERRFITILSSTEDFKEGLNAFFEKRQPRFS